MASQNQAGEDRNDPNRQPGAAKSSRMGDGPSDEEQPAVEPDPAGQNRPQQGQRMPGQRDPADRTGDQEANDDDQE